MSLISSRISTALFLITPAATLASLYLLIINNTLLVEIELISSTPAPINFLLALDPWGLLFATTVIFISANVLNFSSSYINADLFLPRFIILVIMFVLSILLLIFIPHIIALLLGWDGLGLVSFCLVIYYQNPNSLAAGIITALTNRIGDVLILISIALCINLGHWSIINLWSHPLTSSTTALIMLAAITNSAQIPFSSWLPAAIAAPTPVSALVHSSTLVTAGVFLLIRFYPFLSKTWWFSPAILIIASLTILMAGIAATAETDLNNIIALSTLSQLGVIMISLGLGLQTLTLFHLLTHALFNALLFLTAGAVIHSHLHNQDLRTTGSLTHQIPLSIACLTVANIALTGLPFLSGFYSNDAILEFSILWPFSASIIFIAILGTIITSLYSIRFILFLTWSPIHQPPLHQINDEDASTTSPIIALTLIAVVAGAALNWSLMAPLLHPFLPDHLNLLPLTVTIIGLIIGWHQNSTTDSHKSPLLSLPLWHWPIATIWFLAPLSSQGTLNAPYQLANIFTSSLDHGWLENSGPQGIFRGSQLLSQNLQPWNLSPMTSLMLLSVTAILPVIIFLQ